MTARWECPKSAPVASTAPTTATPIPTQATVASRRPCPSAIRPCQTGWVAPRAVAAATEVNWALGIQVAKWAASATPDRTQNQPSRRPAPRIRVRSSARRRSRVTGLSRPTEMVFRQNAIASAGAAAYAISGPEEETAATARITAPVLSGSTGGRPVGVTCGDGTGRSSHARVGH